MPKALSAWCVSILSMRLRRAAAAADERMRRATSSFRILGVAAKTSSQTSDRSWDTSLGDLAFLTFPP